MGEIWIGGGMWGAEYVVSYSLCCKGWLACGNVRRAENEGVVNRVEGFHAGSENWWGFIM